MDHRNERGSLLRGREGNTVIDHLNGKYRDRYAAMTPTEQRVVRMYYDVLQSETKLTQQERAERAMQVYLLKRENQK